MKNITIKIYDAVKNTGEVKLSTKDGKPTIIKAQKAVNYEFFDHSIERAPNHIVTKRHGDDLYVSFERNGRDTDLIIEDFYENGEQALIGIAEDGQYYHYIPDTGQVADYVTQLEVNNIEGQALGGEHIVAPLWVALPVGGFPWWIGLGLVPLLFLNKGDDDNDSSEPDTSTVEPKLEMLKGSVIKADAKVGDDITYVFEVKNTGNVDICNVKITDEKLGLTNVSIKDKRFTLVAGNQNDGHLQVGESIKLSFKSPPLTQKDFDDGKVENTVIYRIALIQMI